MHISNKLERDETGKFTAFSRGKDGWRAPEILVPPEGAVPKATLSTDIFQAGMLLFYAFTGGHHLFQPPNGEGKVPSLTPFQIMTNIAQNKHCLSIIERTAPELHDLVQSMVSIDPAHRHESRNYFSLSSDMRNSIGPPYIKFARIHLYGRRRRALTSSWIRRRIFSRPLPLREARMSSRSSNGQVTFSRHQFSVIGSKWPEATGDSTPYLHLCRPTRPTTMESFHCTFLDLPGTQLFIILACSILEKTHTDAFAESSLVFSLQYGV